MLGLLYLIASGGSNPSRSAHEPACFGKSHRFEAWNSLTGRAAIAEGTATRKGRRAKSASKRVKKDYRAFEEEDR